MVIFQLPEFSGLLVPELNQVIAVESKKDAACAAPGDINPVCWQGYGGVGVRAPAHKSNVVGFGFIERGNCLHGRENRLE